MKRNLQILAGIALISIPSTLLAQSAPPSATNMVVGYQIGKEDANSRTWLKIVQTTDAQGKT
ncbi:MAG: hypothetical protein KGJ60_12190, partial [Verrucomicrobiota bacterium]|nr:hypothetical protein [Verrucomicrobiota bacterium]